MSENEPTENRRIIETGDPEWACRAGAKRADAPPGQVHGRDSGSGVLDPAVIHAAHVREAMPPDINPFPAGWTRA